MKVLLINGSPHAHGCTRTALDIVAGEGLPEQEPKRIATNFIK